jgi:AcrR family transcriptional regulator
MTGEPNATDALATSARILQAAADLLRTGGVEAVTTRAVATAAGVQPPTLYRQFGDKDGLLDAVTEFVLQNYLHAKRRLLTASDDPVEDLRKLWDLHVDFGLSHPHTYALTYSATRPGKTAAAAKETMALLQQAIARIADQGRLCMSVERAARLVHAGGMGIVLILLQLPPSERDEQLPRIARDNTISAILSHEKKRPAKRSSIPARAVALAEAVQSADQLAMSPAERALLTEWLTRIANHTSPA